ncbi:TetR/AcrR family transcriptional regulator [Propionibacteriaceae bacterium Y2011]|uniref:TetR/AcrR family transcriptional regulator n=1 Tax=Microlunatus sp. Y2014 TaxID=3418488 RepID=UPI003B46C631
MTKAGGIGEPTTRDKILAAAAAMLGEDVGARLSVRAVAARAGVSTGSLRHHFPTQRVLQEAVLTGIYDHAFPDDRIHDRTIPPRERLVDCLRQVLAPAGVGQEARAAMAKLHEAFIATEPTADKQAAFHALTVQGRRRVQYWLTVLVDEGALAPGDNVRREQFLNTVLSGLSLARALPTDDSILTTEAAMVQIAVDCVFDTNIG